jgi:hypothetical protein
MTIVYALVSRQKTVLAEHTATSGQLFLSDCHCALKCCRGLIIVHLLYMFTNNSYMTFA